ncbi:MAG TPA: hypothetical protein DCE42_04595 [Myxococcales bacterium]|nr:hypothetical protein [Deltaproteobacteria bacterium]HAA54007.1 hypothetical protein [Myxococcales bacterium]|tara:strand:- start:14 stop:928 length:915 start_codon:yes stop_codon:yes gene_type:complete
MEPFLLTAIYFIAMVLVGWFFVANFVSVVLHRCVAHHAIKLPRWWMYSVMSVCNLCFLYVNPRTWVSDHRNHHAHSDTDKDPDKQPNQSYMDWLIYTILHNPSAQEPEIQKMTGDPIFKSLPFRFFASRPGWILCELSCMTMAYVFFRSIAWSVAFYVTLRVLGIAVLTFQGYLAHGSNLGYGYRTYAVPDNSANITNPFALFLTAGECLQNNHHAKPRFATHSHQKSEKDVGFVLVRMLETVGIAEVPKRSLPDYLTKETAKVASVVETAVAEEQVTTSEETETVTPVVATSEEAPETKVANP